MSTPSSKKRRKDPILGLKTPVMFAHRGGAKEVPESTEEAFRHAVKHGADVLEVDVRLTADNKIVVWHGPGLEKVRGRNNRRFTRWHHIGLFRWRSLHNKVWVLHPADDPTFKVTPKRRLLLLSEFFKLVDTLERELARRRTPRTLHLNIELKASPVLARGWNTSNLNKLLDLVAAQPKHRTIILASMDLSRLNALRRLMARRSLDNPTNLTFSEQLAYTKYMKLRSFRFGLRLGTVLVPQKRSLVNYAFETSHALLSKRLVHKVRRDGGSLYVFLTGIPGAGGIDDEEAKDLEQPLFKMLDTGVDGVMTDYPAKVSALLRKWKRSGR